MRVDRCKLSIELMKRDMTQQQLAELCGVYLCVGVQKGFKGPVRV